MYHFDLNNPSNSGKTCSGTNQTTFSFTLECSCTKSSTKTNSEICLHLCNRFYTHQRLLPVNTCLSCTVASLIVVEFCCREYLWLFSDLNKSHNKTASSCLLTLAFQLKLDFFVSDFKFVKTLNELDVLVLF